MGDTAYDANENATIALGLAKRKGRNKWMAVLDDKTVIGPMSSPVLVKLFNAKQQSCGCCLLPNG